MANLLIVDDEPDLLEALAAVLTDTGYQVEAVTSARAALQALDASKENLPDLIVADIVMPETTGLQLSEVVRRSPNLSDIPFLFISAFVSPEIKDQVSKQDKAAILSKPFDVEDLLQAVEAMCGPIA